MTRCRRYGKIRSFIITKSNRRATLSACATLVWPPPRRGVFKQYTSVGYQWGVHGEKKELIPKRA